MADITEVSGIMQLPSMSRRQPVQKKEPVTPPVEQDKYEPSEQEEVEAADDIPDSFALSETKNSDIVEVDPDDIIVIEPKKTQNQNENDFSWTKTFIASAAGVFTGKKVYEFGKKVMDKGIQYAEKEIGAFEKEFGRDVINMPRQCKAVLKYAIPALAGLAVAGIIIKDADNDGKSDLAEAINKFINPDAGMY